MLIQTSENNTRPTFQITLEVLDLDVISELEKHEEGHAREKYALSAMRLGVLALRQAAGELDASTVRDAAQELLAGLGQLLAERGSEITTDIAGSLRQYFDPSTGALPQRIDALLRNDGDLDRALRAHLGPENSTIAHALSRHLGEGSAIFKLLSPTDAGGVKAQIAGVLEGVLHEQQEQILGEFSLDNKESALSRLVGELASSNGELRTDLQNTVDGLAGEFSLDKPDSALSRLVGRVETAHKAISNEFSADNENSAIARLSRMLQDTSRQIDRNLTLDDDGSALSRLKRELVTTIESLVTSNDKFQNEVRTTLAALQARKAEASRSTRHGLTFENEAGLVIEAEAQQLNDFCDRVGASTGKNGKTGDFVTTLGPDSAAPGTHIVWEAKEDKSYTLKKARAEIASARANREAQIGVFIFSRKAAPEGLQPFARYGRDVVIVWDAEDVASDLYVKTAYTLARALVIRENHDSVESEHALKAIDLSARSIEKQLAELDQLKKWADSVMNNGERMSASVAKMRGDLAKEVEALDRQVDGLKAYTALAA